MASRVAIVGGGLAGAVCAETLALRGFDVHVFDMGRRATGGRASVRRTQEGYFFNHGVQFVKISDEALAKRSRDWEKSGALLHWPGRHGRYDAKLRTFTDASAAGARGGAGGDDPDHGFCSFLDPRGKLWINNGLTELLTQQRENIRVSLGSAVSSLTWDASQSLWQLAGRSFGEPRSFGAFDAVVLGDAMTGRRGSPGHILLHENGESAAEASGSGESRPEGKGSELGLTFPVLDAVRVKPAFSLMIAFPPGTIDAPFDAATIVNSSVFQWVSLENSKPNYSSDLACQSFVAISTFEMAERLLAANPQQKDHKFVEQTSAYLARIEVELAEAFMDLMRPMLAAERDGRTAAASGSLEPVYVKAQRWGGAFYSNDYRGEGDGEGEGARRPPSFVDEGKKLALCGDFCARVSTAENAMLSGLSCGERLASILQRPQ